MLALNWDRKKIQKETGAKHTTYFTIKAEYEGLSEDRKAEIKASALGEEKARARFEDYEFVEHWITRMKSGRKPIKSWRKNFNCCRRVWEILQKKNPEKWTLDDVDLRVLPELRKTVKRSINQYLVSLRSLRPNFKFPNEKGDVLSTDKKPEPSFEWKYVYERIMSQNKLDTFFKVGGFKAELLKRLQLTLGTREGTKGEGGILGLEWDRINWKKKTIDVYEAKTGGGFYWRDCPLDLFDDTTFEMLQQYWTEKGKPTSGRIFEGMNYVDHLRSIYKETAKALGEEYGNGKGITPHFARKLHACLLIDADVPLEMVAGDGHFGIMGVGWDNLDTLRKYYLAFRKSKIIEARIKARGVMFD
jgi:integrase